MNGRLTTWFWFGCKIDSVRQLELLSAILIGFFMAWLPISDMDIEKLIGVLVSAAVPSITSAVTNFFRKPSSKSKLGFINPPSEELANNPEFKQFNDRIRNEEHMSIIFQRPVRDSEVIPAIGFCNSGLATCEDVSKAWTYREIKNGKLYFSVPKIMFLWMWARYAYAFVCFVSAVLLILIFFALRDYSAKSVSGLIMAIPLMVLAAAAKASTSGVRTAIRLSKIRS